MLQLQTEKEQYWTEWFEVTNEDIDHIFNIFLEEEIPLSSREIAHRLIQFRLEQEAQTLRRQIERGEIFQPKNRYAIGERLIFPALGYQVGEVIDQRAGNNPEHGPFTVIKVSFSGDETREFASELQNPHQLNIDSVEAATTIGPKVANVDTILKDYGDDIIYMLEERLHTISDVVHFGGRWFLKSLLADVGIVHLHLAEAVLVMNNGGPLDTAGIVKEIDMPKEVNAGLQTFSLDYALFHDPRFDEVGPAGKVLWYLRDLEPEEVITAPERLQYAPFDYNWGALSDELAAIENEIDDELSKLRSPSKPADSVTFSLNFPHRRTGTLPLSSRLRHLFPTAYEAPHILMTLVDAQTNESMMGWVVREHSYVYGLGEFYRRYKLPVGTYITVRKTDDPSRVVIDFVAHRPHSEWIRLAVPGENKRLSFENQKRSIGADYDELMVLGAEDLQGIDDLWIPTEHKSPDLLTIMRTVIGELERLTPQHSVHAKTIYSAVNVIRRFPPGPIFAALVERPEFEHVGGPYWRLA